MEPRKQAIMDALDKFVSQRSGMDFRNYGDVKSFRAEQRSITKDLHQYRELAKYVQWHDSITADMLLEASRSAFSGRLEIREQFYRCGGCESFHRQGFVGDCRTDSERFADLPTNADEVEENAQGTKVRIDYCTGQYFPTEYRRAACAVLASAIWHWTREHAMPKPIAKNGDHTYYPMHYPLAKKATLLSAGDWLRANFKREFGGALAARWFD